MEPLVQCQVCQVSMRLARGSVSWLSSHGRAPSCCAFTHRVAFVREPLVRRQGSQVSMRVARGSASWLSSHGRGLGPRDALKKVHNHRCTGAPGYQQGLFWPPGDIWFCMNSFGVHHV